MSRTPSVARLAVEYGLPIVGTAQPRLSWVVESKEPWHQRSYELEADGERSLVESDASVFVPWPFAPLRSRERREVRVRATSRSGATTPWSDKLIVEAGLLEAGDWRASFVGPSDRTTQLGSRLPLLRREFGIDRPIASATLYTTALGVYETYLNGTVVGDEVLAPNWTSYHSRLRYQTFPVGDTLRQGRNVIGVMLGDGWYRGRLIHQNAPYGTRLGFLAQLEIVFTDGTLQTVLTDTNWRTSAGPILVSSLYDGERHDARLEAEAWTTAGFDDEIWEPVELIEHSVSTLVTPTDPPIRRIEELDIVDTFVSPSGKRIVDFGQNLVGRLRITVAGESGETITIRHAEVLEDGELAERPLRTARAEDSYTLRGGAIETWEPRFTFHGFRYAEISGWPEDFDPSRVQAVVLHSDLRRTGWFECSHAAVNQLHENAVWSMRGNFVGLPTDCPQRDERLGWTGDIQIFAPAASFLFDVNGLLVSWLADLAAEQLPDGRVPAVVPAAVIAPRELASFPDPLFSDITAAWSEASAAGWGDAAVIVPWVLYQRFGDRDLLRRQWQSMQAWVDHVERLAGPSRLWKDGFQFGDWLDPTAPPDSPHQARTPPDLVATAYFARSAELVGRAAQTLGLSESARRYEGLAKEVRAAFFGAFGDLSNGRAPVSTTGLALAIVFGLLASETELDEAGRHLSALVAESGYRMTTGFLGTPIICDALCEVGRVEDAYRLLLQTDCPSWLYQVSNGATTIWERWDSVLPDGRLNPGEMTSFNHYAFGAIVDWLHRAVAGLEPAEPGYRVTRVRPILGSGISHASARHETPYGPAAVAWHRNEGMFQLEVEIPPNTTAEIHLPGTPQPLAVASGRHVFAVSEPVESDRAPGGVDAGMLASAGTDTADQ
jgi:alpha-L-rhamnosidase